MHRALCNGNALIVAAKAAAAPVPHLWVAQRGGAPGLALLLEPSILPQLHALRRHLEHLWGGRAATGQNKGELAGCSSLTHRADVPQHPRGGLQFVTTRVCHRLLRVRLLQPALASQLDT